METVNTYITQGSIDVATLIVGVVFLAFFFGAASVLARHHLGMVTAIVGAGVWIISGLLLARQREILASLVPLIGAEQARFDMTLVASMYRLAPWVFALGVLIAVVALVFRRIEAARAPVYEPLEDQHQPEQALPHEPHRGAFT